MAGFGLTTDPESIGGKSIAAVRESKQKRNFLLSLFGRDDMPSSIMKAKKAKLDENFDEHAAKRGYQASSWLTKTGRSGMSAEMQTSLSSSGKGCSAGALSTFPQNIGRSIVLMYSDPGQTVFDPFAGHNSRMDLCIKAGRNYIGCDLSTEFMTFNRKRAKQLRKQYPKSTIELHHGDSRKIPVADGTGDFTITSPPYYDIEEYGDEPEQLGKCPTYGKFLKGIRQVLRENFRCLKPGAYAVWFINDFRRKGKMYFYHCDIIRLGQEVGFIAHDIMITDFGPGIRDCFINQALEQRILPKRHETGVVFRKPLEAT